MSEEKKFEEIKPKERSFSGSSDSGGRRARRLEHLPSITTIPGREGAMLSPQSQTGKTIGVFTSGGDSQGKFLKTL